MKSSSLIPSIEMDALINPSYHSAKTRHSTAQQLLNALETFGVAYLSFTGASSEAYDTKLIAARAEATAFFSSPLHHKQTATAAPGTFPPGVTRGYLAIGSESGSTQFENKEAFSWSCDLTVPNPNPALTAPNLWPENSASLQQSFMSLFSFFHTVMQAVADGLQTTGIVSSSVSLKDMVINGADVSLLRAFHYHPTDNISYPSAIGSSPHTDWGFATLVAQDDNSEPALQVLHPDHQQWIPILPRPRTLILNGSDFLALISSRRIRSPLHRVILTHRSRTSFVYFQYPPASTPMPEISADHENHEMLSLLTDQRADDGEKKDIYNMTGDSFGNVIARKWTEVGRIEKN